MRGARFGTITKLGNHPKRTTEIAQVQLDKVKRPKWFRQEDLEVIG